MSTNEGWDDTTDDEANRIAADEEDDRYQGSGPLVDGDDAETALLVAGLAVGS